ncbi:MAG: NAD(FAD)-utilizing dehydrogenase, partial [Firmicutes bacterium]|nr:NAD(FAD)-utilizing dehydrogenase [Bacillota bacterium]
TIHLESGGIRTITVRDLRNDGQQKEDLTEIPCQALVLAVGHSARDTFRMLHECGIAMEQKPFSIGVRIEHPQDMIDISQYGRPGRQLGLPPAEYKINYRCAADGPAAGRGVYTFCMCPGGQVIVASSQEGGVVTNGMSYHGRDSGTANSALLCDVRTSDFGSSDVLAGVAFQEKYEHLAFQAGRKQNPDGKPYSPPQTTWGRLRDGLAPEVEECLPTFAVAAFREAMPQLGKKLHGFDGEDAVMTAVETRSSSPVRILRGETYESAASGLYPCGEGAGYAGGITSAAVDGIRVAEAIIRKWKPAAESRKL